MKIVVPVLIVVLAVAAIVLGFNDHKVLAGVSAYLSVALIVLAFNHGAHRRDHKLGGRHGLRAEAHGCYEMDNED